MIKSKIHSITLCASLLMSLTAFSGAPVVDESENFASIEEMQQAANQPSVDEFSYDEDKALAKEDAAATHSDNNTTTANIDLVDKIQGLQKEVQDLRGQLEVQAHDLKMLQQQQLAFYKDIDSRLRGEKGGASPLAMNQNTGIVPPKSPGVVKNTSVVAPVVPAPVNANNGNPADEQISYLAAYDLVKSKKYDAAIDAMQKFVTYYPQGGYTANAHYWLGELYLVKKDYGQSISHFDIVLNKFPSSPKAAPSLLKTGYALAASGKREDAKQTLQQVMRNYPDTQSAHLAATKLENLGGL